MTLEQLESRMTEFDKTLQGSDADLDFADEYHSKKEDVYKFVREALSDNKMFPGNACECPDNYEPWCLEGGSPVTGYIDNVTKLSLKDGIVWAHDYQGHRICFLDIFSYDGMVLVAGYLTYAQHPEVNYNGEDGPWKDRWFK